MSTFSSTTLYSTEFYEGVIKCLIPTWKHRSKTPTYCIKSFCDTEEKISLELFEDDRLESFLESSFAIIHLPSFAMEGEFFSPMNLGEKGNGKKQRDFHAGLKEQWREVYGTYRYWAFLECLQQTMLVSPTFLKVDKVAVVSADYGGCFLARENLNFVNSKGILLADPNRDLIDILEFGLSDTLLELSCSCEIFDSTNEMPPIFAFVCSHEKQCASLTLLKGKSVQELYSEFDLLLDGTLV